MMSQRKLVASVILFISLSTACSVALRQPSSAAIDNGSSTSPQTVPIQVRQVTQAQIGPTPTAIPDDQRLLVDQEEQVLENIYQRVNPSVVYIGITQQVTRRRGGGVTVTGSASGFVIDKQGHIVTNNHVVDRRLSSRSSSPTAPRLRRRWWARTRTMTWQSSRWM
jgi:S1-C subfamily serine protease